MAAGLLVSKVPAGAQESVQPAPAEQHFRIWDVHSHLGPLPGNTPEERLEVLIRHMDRLGIERVILSQGFEEFEYHPTPEQVRIENDRIMRAVKHFPDRAYGSLYISPDNVEFCLQEFDRCVRDGPMVSIGEIETDVKCN
jgi:predicted TIM-barrel fold metal-dependent hydrolase